MKKLVALLLAAMMLLGCVTAMAEGESSTKTMQSAFLYGAADLSPASWMDSAESRALFTMLAFCDFAAFSGTGLTLALEETSFVGIKDEIVVAAIAVADSDDYVMIYYNPALGEMALYSMVENASSSVMKLALNQTLDSAEENDLEVLLDVATKVNDMLTDMNESGE